jgi:hypothetical protein
VTHPATDVAQVLPAWNHPEAVRDVLDEVPREPIDQIPVVVPSAAGPHRQRPTAHLRRNGTRGLRQVTHQSTDVALVIPAWNEPDAIGAVLKEVPSPLVDDVLVVVDSAMDPTSPARPATRLCLSTEASAQ